MNTQERRKPRRLTLGSQHTAEESNKTEETNTNAAESSTCAEAVNDNSKISYKQQRVAQLLDSATGTDPDNARIALDEAVLMLDHAAAYAGCSGTLMDQLEEELSKCKTP